MVRCILIHKPIIHFSYARKEDIMKVKVNNKFIDKNRYKPKYLTL